MIFTPNILDPTLSSIVFPASASATCFLTCLLLIQFNGKKKYNSGNKKPQRLLSRPLHTVGTRQRVCRRPEDKASTPPSCVPALPLLFQKAGAPALLESLQPQTDKSQDSQQVVLVQGLVLLGWGGSPHTPSSQSGPSPWLYQFLPTPFAPPLLPPPLPALGSWDPAWHSGGCRNVLV